MQEARLDEGSVLYSLMIAIASSQASISSIARSMMLLKLLRQGHSTPQASACRLAVGESWSKQRFTRGSGPTR